jgi:hypothetical protein
MGARISKYALDRGVRDEFQLIMRSFAHDPTSARCLITITLIGMMLAEVASAYGELLEELDNALKLTVTHTMARGSNTRADRYRRRKTLLWKG